MPMIKSGHEAERMFGEQFEAMVHAEHSVAHRGDSYKLFSEAGLPGRRIESWHYTDLRGLVREALPPAAEPDAATVETARERLKAHAVPGAARLVPVSYTHLTLPTKA